MAGKPANITQPVIDRFIKAARKAGAPAVEYYTKDGAKIVVRLTSSTGADDPPLEPKREIIL